MQLLSQRPFLSRFSTERTSGPDIPGKYSDDLNMWAIETIGGINPIIEGNPYLSELTTKTNANQEEDKTDYSLVELTTKTESEVERDDEKSFGTNALLEITTKTDAELERDDTSPSIVGFL